MPRGWSHLADQLTRASLSIVLNLAEGAGKSAALVDVCVRLTLLDDAGHEKAKAMLVRIVSMLVKLAQSCEGQGARPRTE